MPTTIKGPLVGVVSFFRVHVQICRIGGVNELKVGKCRSTVGGHELVERRPDCPMGAVVLIAKCLPVRIVVRGIPRKDRGDRIALYLEGIARNDAHKWHTGGHQRGEAQHVVLNNHIGLDPLDDVL